METIKTGISWVDDEIPEGLPLKSTTVITGVDDSGKPFIGEVFLTACVATNNKKLWKKTG